jgi:cullin-associated NEDD8-dissociated protein 1
MADLYIRFAPIVSASQTLQSTSVDALIKILSSSKLSIRKRAIPALGALVSSNPKLFDGVKPKISAGLSAGGDTGKVWAAVIGSLARGQSAQRVGALINEGKVVNLLLQQTEDPEDDETTEGALMVSNCHASS